MEYSGSAQLDLVPVELKLCDGASGWEQIHNVSSLVIVTPQVHAIMQVQAPW